MAKVEDCPGFETFGADVKAARKAKHLTRKVLAEIVGIEWRYLANIPNLVRDFFKKRKANRLKTVAPQRFFFLCNL